MNQVSLKPLIEIDLFCWIIFNRNNSIIFQVGLQKLTQQIIPFQIMNLMLLLAQMEKETH